jgi:cardiolipin synthase
MDKNLARKLADSLTWARIISVVPITLAAWYGLKWWVFGLYIAAALTDWFDGMLARRAVPAGTDFDLDGIADLVLSFATLFWFWLLVPEFVLKYWLPYVPVIVLLEVYMTYVRLRHNRFGIPHLQFGRFAMALFFFLLPVVILWGDVAWFVHGVLLIGVASKVQLSWAFWNRRAA